MGKSAQLRAPSRRPPTAARWVVEIGAAHVAAAQFEVANGRVELSRLAHRNLPPSEAGEEMDPVAVAAALQELKADLGWRGEVVLVIPGHLALIKQVRVPAVAEAQQAQLIEFEVRQGMPFELEQVYWSYQQLGRRDGEWEVLVVAAKTTGVDRVLQTCQTVGINVQAVVAAGPTLLPVAAAPGRSGALISVGARATHLVFREGERTHLRTLNAAGNAVTLEIANRLEQPFAEVELLKLGVTTGRISLPDETPAGAAVKAAGQNFAARLKLELNRTLVTQVRPAGINPPQAVRLVGGGAGLPGLGEAVGAAPSASIEEWPSPVDLQLSASAQSVVAQVGAERFADLIGAYLSIGPAGEVAFDLAPPRMREARAAKRQRPLWIVAATLVALAAYLPGWHYHRLAAARLAAADAVRQQTVPVQALRDQAAAHLTELERLGQSTQFWEDRRRSQTAWEALLNDLQHSLVKTGDVWFERWQMLPAADTSSAATDAEPRPRLRVSGRLLDRENPLSRVSQNAYERVTGLLESFVESPRVVALEGERFDASEPGMLRFDVTLVLNPRSGL